MDKRKTFDEHWEQILNNFNFQRVLKIMEFLDWKWGWRNPEVPNLEEIIGSAKERAMEAYEMEGGSASGGFYAKYNAEGDKLKLSFELCDWTTVWKLDR